MLRLISASGLLACLAALALATPALAYVDPNTGGMLFQVLVVVFTFFSAFVLFFSRYIRQAVGRARRLVRDRAGVNQTGTESEQPA